MADAEGIANQAQTDQVFVSYSRDDKEFVRQLVDDLRQWGVGVWLDVDRIFPPMDWDEAINNALDDPEIVVMVLVLSPDSMASTVVKAEWTYFLGHRGKPIVPVMYRLTKVPFRLYDLQYISFENKPYGSKEYKEAFETLLAALRRCGVASRPQALVSAPPSEPPVIKPVSLVSAPLLTDLPRLQMEPSFENYAGLGLEVVRRHQNTWLSIFIAVLVISGLVWGYPALFPPDGDSTPANSVPITETFEAERAATMNALRTEAAARDATRTANAHFGTPTFTGTPAPTFTETPDGTATWNALLTEAAATHAAETATATTPTPLTGS